MKARTSILSLLMLITFSHKVSAQNFSQFYLSEVWDEEGGTMPMFYRAASTIDDQRNVYVVGSTASDTSGFDILVQKFSRESEIIRYKLLTADSAMMNISTTHKY